MPVLDLRQKLDELELTLRKQKLDQHTKSLADFKRCDRIMVKRKGKSVDVGLENIFRDRDLIQNLPTIWLDWKSRLDSRLIIIGQDWGPVSVMREIADGYRLRTVSLTETDEIWTEFVNNPSDRTTKDMFKYLKKSAQITQTQLQPEFIDDIFVTMSVLFARQGTKFRGNDNFAEKESARCCTPLLKEQIQIVRPEVIAPLGGLALWSLSQIFGFEFKVSLTAFLENLPQSGHIQVNLDSDTKIKIVPLIHPAAHIHPDIQLKYYCNIWKALKNDN